MRQYEPIWLALKKDERCTISAPKMYHRRIIKAVIKEKWQDVGDKFYKGESYKKGRLSYTIDGSTIQFILTTNPGLGDI